MKKTSILIILVLTNIFISNVLAVTPGERRHLLMDYNWKFIQSDVKGAEAPAYNDAAGGHLIFLTTGV